MSDSNADGDIAFVRIQQRSNPDVQTYEAIPRAELAMRLAEADGEVIVESCDIALPPVTVAKLAADLAPALQSGTRFIGTVTAGIWISGPLAGQDGPRGREWYG